MIDATLATHDAIRCENVNIRVTNPLADDQWDSLVAQHPRATVFHRRGWLEALVRTYGYEPFVLTSSPTGRPLKDGIVFCRVSSWITGNRLVSVPFADHCEPLLDCTAAFPPFAEWLRRECNRENYGYVELRPLTALDQPSSALQVKCTFCRHTLDLKPPIEQIFQRLHKDSIQRKIHRAEREKLSYEVGVSDQLVREFYRLLLMTRRRHQLPPQPVTWFKNLVECMGDSIQIRLARKNGTPIAAMVTLRHRSSIVYKYGCSDARFHNLGGMPFLFWRLIEESRASNVDDIDFGRSDLDNESLVTFKDKFGTKRATLKYYCYSGSQPDSVRHHWDSRVIRRLFSVLPDKLLSAVGGVLYKHTG